MSETPLPLRHVIAGGVLLGVIGAAVGLIVGVVVYVPTAWFAMFELGVPAAVFGGTLGLVSGIVAKNTKPFETRKQP